jgi:hypothetical protein
MKKKSDGESDARQKHPSTETESGTERDVGGKGVVRSEASGGGHEIVGPSQKATQMGPGKPMSKADAVEKVLRKYDVAFRRLADR